MHCDTLLSCDLEIFLLTYLHVKMQKSTEYSQQVEMCWIGSPSHPVTPFLLQNALNITALIGPYLAQTYRSIQCLNCQKLAGIERQYGSKGYDLFWIGQITPPITISYASGKWGTIISAMAVKQSSNFWTSVLKFEFDLHTFGIRTSDWNLSRFHLIIHWCCFCCSVLRTQNVIKHAIK